MKGKKGRSLAALGCIAGVSVIVGLAVYFSGGPGEGKEPYVSPYEAYIALPEDTVYTMRLGYFYQAVGDRLIFGENAVEAKLVGSEGVEVSPIVEVPGQASRRVEDMWYNKWDMEVSFPGKGLYRVTELEVTTADGAVTRWPIGEWYFDVGEVPPAEYEVIYNGIGAASATAYNYIFDLPEGAALKRLQYGPEAYLEGEELDRRGQIPLDLEEGWVSLIQPKLEFEVDGRRVTTYGSHSYSGFSQGKWSA